MANVVIWEAVTSNNKKSLIFWVIDGMKIKQKTKLDLLKSKAKP